MDDNEKRFIRREYINQYLHYCYLHNLPVRYSEIARVVRYRENCLLAYWDSL